MGRCWPGRSANVTLERADQPIGCTPHHPFWSEDRRSFVPASDLRDGEVVRTRTLGAVRINSVTHRPREDLVYNLEVHGEHVYEVSEFGVLVHNTYPRFVAPKASSARPSIRKNDLDSFQGFKDRSVVGDGLEGHELLQHAWLKEHGHATRRLGNDVSQGNPVISLKRKTHQKINSAQSGMDLPSQTAVENILANRRIMLEQGFSRTRVNRLTIKALEHASENGL